ncbi:MULTISPECIES: CheR family methyltransferase [Methylosinus]|uniref:protein-glutamate O-methyltransferase n=1 Tax=Methylosinus trichosporium (strain ATCC 35070 / NCIMB 11131 / UNIQEM 75 / OB3b) TaxID=595536 RepID=A0A2D2D5H1_METT3|nr:MULTISPECIES: protein-glutamate O-methyltransferase CheR [Methylosinus]ATQ70291.1 chemotaxis protein CheR [Methylosinus trichosporium OB3b]OBS53820.1 chemotaxis protein CheR [Methylosinus sp. 3S-1]
MSVAFARLRRLLLSVAGLSLDADKLYLAESRLAPLMLENGDIDLAELMRRIERSGDEQFLQAVIDAMTTNETFFFRDRAPFEWLRRHWLPEIMARRRDQRRLRIWSAACSTGQEPYSLAMTFEEEAERLDGWRVEILASDISETALEAARRGVYSQFEVQRGLSTARLLRHFEPPPVIGGWRVNARLRGRVVFRKINLCDDFREIGAFDLILCRNVLMYLDGDVKRQVLSRLAGSLESDGHLILGTSENVGPANRSFTPDAAECGWRLRRKTHARRLAAVGG